jgi:hypothetical protein
MAKRRVPPFRFRTKAAAHSGGKLKAGCRTIRVRGSVRYLCKLHGA